MKSVMELLYELRVDHDLTQAEVGAVLGISQQHYSNYETGEYELPLRHIVSLAYYYQVSADYLIGRHHNLELKEEDMVYLTAQYSCGNLLRDVMGLSAKGRQAVLEYVHLLQLKEQSKMRIELVARMKKAQNWSMNSPSGWAGFSCAYIEILVTGTLSRWKIVEKYLKRIFYIYSSQHYIRFHCKINKLDKKHL